MKVFSVGVDEVDFVDSEDFVWLVYDYEYGYYEGNGTAYALRKDGKLFEFSLSHCSCYGPEDDFPNNGDEVSIKSVLKPIESAIDERSNPIVDKLRELLG